MSDSRESTVGCTRTTLDSMTNVFLARLDSPIGRIEIAGDGDAVTSLSIERDGALPHDGEPERSNDRARPGASPARRVLRRTPHRLRPAGLARRHRVPARRLGSSSCASTGARSTPTVSSAGDRSATAGPAARSAAPSAPTRSRSSCRCHRVLGSDGRITGYSGGDGIPTKSWLLDHEGIGTFARRRASSPRRPSVVTRRRRPGALRLGGRRSRVPPLPRRGVGHAPARRPVRCSRRSASRGSRPGSRGSRSSGAARPSARSSHGFDVERVAAFDESDVERLLGDARIIRNRAQDRGDHLERPCARSSLRPGAARPAPVGLRPAARATRPSSFAEMPATTPESDGDEQGAPQARLPLRRADHDVRPHAVGRHGRRPPRRVLARVSRSSAATESLSAPDVRECSGVGRRVGATALRRRARARAARRPRSPRAGPARKPSAEPSRSARRASRSPDVNAGTPW